MRCDIGRHDVPTIVPLGDGRGSCQSCAATGVRDEGLLRRMELEVRSWLTREFGFDFLYRPWTEVRLVDRPTLVGLLGASTILAPGEAGGVMATEWVVTSTGRRPSRLTLAILSGFPARHTWTALAHELTHLWQASAFPYGADLLWVEGLATFIEREAWLDLGEPGCAEALACGDHPVYGEGYRRVRRLQGAGPRRAVPRRVVAMARGEALARG